MTSRSLGDDSNDSSTARTTIADVAQQGREPERVGSDGFVDAILSMAEHRAEAGERQLGVNGAETPTDAVAERPVAPSVVSDDFIDAVLEVAELRAAEAATAAAELSTRQAAAAPTSIKSHAAKPTTARARTTAPSQNAVLPVRAAGVVANATADLDVAPWSIHHADSDDTDTHFHPTRPTPWWRKRPSLETVFAVIATVLMVIGLALVISELF